MIIREIRIHGFKGIRDAEVKPVPKVAALVGDNGKGKTSFLEAVQFALTGEEPEGDWKTAGEDGHYVSLKVVDQYGEEHVFTRSKPDGKPSKAEVDGRTTTLKSLNESIEQAAGIRLSGLKAGTVPRLVMGMDPGEFGKLILSYSNDVLTKETLLEKLPGMTMGAMDIMESELPEELTMEGVDAFCERMKEERKSLKRDISQWKAVLKDKPTEKPAFTRKSVEAERKALLEKEKAAAALDERRKAYERYLSEKERYGKMLSELEERAKEAKTEKPDTEKARALSDEEKSLKASVSNLSSIIGAQGQAMKGLEKSLSEIDSPACPLSKKVRCTSDKSEARSDIEEGIKAAGQAKALAEEELKKAEGRLSEIAGEKAAYNKEAAKYIKYVELSKQYASLIKNPPAEVEKPAEAEPHDFAADAVAIDGRLKVIEAFEEAEDLSRRIGEGEARLADCEALVKAFSEKGEARGMVLKSLTGPFEDMMNGITGDGPKFKLEAEGGIRVYMESHTGAMLPYEALSSGEKAYMLFVTASLMSALTGTRMLMLDELSVLDRDTLSALLDIISERGDEFDHVFITAVGHEDIRKAMASHGIPELSIA